MAQPFGGALRIADPAGFRSAVGDFTYDSPHSRQEADLRILIPPAAWETVKQFILAQLRSNHPEVIEVDPCRELEEEFRESVGISLLPEHYTYRPVGISVQNGPRPTTNPRSPGTPTVRIYRIFEVAIHNPVVCATLLENSQRYTDDELHALAESGAARGGPGRANSALVLPLDEVQNAYRQISVKDNTRSLSLLGHSLDSISGMLFDGNLLQ